MSQIGVFTSVPLAELVWGLVLLWLLLGLGRNLLSSRWQREKKFLRDASASAVLDFTLVFPLFTMVLLVLIQLALLINARLVVNYAAFAACRSAVVWLQEGEAVALEKAQQAAAVGCLALAPADGSVTPGYLLAPTVAPLFLHGDASSGDLGRRITRGASKLVSAQGSTRVEIDRHEFGLGPHNPVTVTVEHDFYLSVPFAERLFRDGLGGLGLPIHTLRDHYTLTHEGRVQSR